MVVACSGCGCSGFCGFCLWQWLAMVVVALGFYLCMCVWVLKEGGAKLGGLLDKFGGGVFGERIFELEDFLASDLWE